MLDNTMFLKFTWDVFAEFENHTQNTSILRGPNNTFPSQVKSAKECVTIRIGCRFGVWPILEY